MCPVEQGSEKDVSKNIIVAFDYFPGLGLNGKWEISPTLIQKISLFQPCKVARTTLYSIFLVFKNKSEYWPRTKVCPPFTSGMRNFDANVPHLRRKRKGANLERERGTTFSSSALFLSGSC